ncbi:MAG TPA: PIN domain-containing protein [Tepidisphaeraceae bacterium]|jgi:predicted nucleic acid-binding protein
MTALLDTSFAIEALRDNPKAYAAIAGDHTLYISVHVLAELLAGIGPQTPDKMHQALRRFRSRVNIMLPTVRTAEVYADIRRESLRTGQKLPQNDTWIAATAVEHDQTLISFDAHFDRIKGLRHVLVK